MKFNKTWRNSVDKAKFIENKSRGSFLDRFKGRTMKISKDGHLGIVNSTKIPIKPIIENKLNYCEGKEIYNNFQRNNSHELMKNRKQMSNYEALMNRSNSVINHSASNKDQRYNKFENF